MNLYLVLALALGAISGTAVAPVAQPPVANVVHLECGGHAAALDRKERQHARGTGRSACATPMWHRHSCLYEAPLTGAATPRAPALSR